MSKWNGKSRGGAWGFRFFIFLLKTLGLRFAYFFTHFIVPYFLIFSDKKHIQYFYHDKLGYTKAETSRALYKNYSQLGKSLLDRMYALSGNAYKFTYDFEGEHHLHDMVRAGKGGLLISAHLGNWEIAGNLLERINTSVNIVMFDAEHQKIKDLVKQSVGQATVKIIVMRNDMSHIYDIQKAFENNELVCLHADRYVEGSKTLECDFLSGKALFPYGPFYLAMQFNVPYTFVFALKETPEHYHFYATQPKFVTRPENHKLRDATIKEVCNEYIRELEAKIKLAPYQWYNYHKFWNTEY